MAYKVFANGFPLPASDLNNYLMRQSVLVFASSGDRSSQLTDPVEGMLSWLQDSNKFQYYTGSAWADLISTPLSTKTANYSTVATDAGSTIVVDSASNLTITIDNNLSTGQRIDFIRKGTGTVTFAAGAGVTLNSKSGNLKLNAQYSGGSVVAIGSSTYILIGDLVA